MDKVRVLRLIEYIGPRDWVEAVVRRSIHGTQGFGDGKTIRVATLGEFPEIIEIDHPYPPEPEPNHG